MYLILSHILPEIIINRFNLLVFCWMSYYLYIGSNSDTEEECYFLVETLTDAIGLRLVCVSVLPERYFHSLEQF